MADLFQEGKVKGHHVMSKDRQVEGIATHHTGKYREPYDNHLSFDSVSC